MTDQMRVTVERDGHVLLMGLNRADDRNFFDFAMLEQLVTADGRPAHRFAGDAWMWPRIGATEHTEVRVVLFTPGARSAWHRHPAGQALHVTEGAGLVQSRGGVREEVRAGDTVTTAPGEWHWHAAAPGTFMVHLAVTDGTTEWAGQVTDDEYQG
jgi:quercetin dioxygenase-like cupin family protein